MSAWRCLANPCNRYQIAEQVALNQSVAGLVVVRRGQAFCSNCNAPQPVTAIPAALLPAETPDYYPQADYNTGS
jgi:hypothetical protein